MGDIPTRVVLLVGAGSQLNSWEPVRRALCRVGSLDIESPDEANGILTGIVQARRYFALANAYLRDRNGAEHQPSAIGLAESEKAYSRACDAIRDELRIAEQGVDGIRLRPEFNDVWNVVVGAGAQTCVMTANWDLTLLAEMARQFPGAGDDLVMHLHGDRRDTSGFLLPSEMTFEPYGCEADIRLLTGRRRAIMTAFEDAKRAVIYGLSFAPLDAELTQVVAFGVETGAVETIEIIDPEHRRVARRLMAIIPSRRPQILGRDPSNFQKVTQHGWSR